MMAVSEPHQVFSTIELLQEVINQVDQPRTLIRCARVNKTWHALAIPILWRGTSDQMSDWRTPTIDHLITLAASPERFRYYISMIEDLVLLHGDRPTPPTWDPGTFFTSDRWSALKAKTILVDLGSHNMEHKCMAVLIQPALISLELFGGYYNDQFLQLLTVWNCQLLCLFTLLIGLRRRDVT